MNSLVWDSKGAGGKNFHNPVKDIMRIYNIDFLAILEPRISGNRAENVIKKIGLDDGVKVEAVGFSAGIWCLWKNACPSISVISTSKFCIHLKVKSNSLILALLYSRCKSPARVYIH